MEITVEKVRAIAHLARLQFTEEEEKALMPEMEQILDWMAKLNELDIDEVEPLTHMTEAVNQFREDRQGQHLDRAKGLKNAPKKDSNYFRVPKVMEGEE